MALESFHETWLSRQQHYVTELLAAAETHDDDDDEILLQQLVSRVIAHYQQYYLEKSQAATTNVFRVFSPTWLTRFERTLLWIGGFKPGQSFGTVASSVTDLSPEQGRNMARLKDETRLAERRLRDQLARVQESVAAPPILELARRWGKLVEGEVEDKDRVFEGFKSAMEEVMTRADWLRMRTIVRVIEILTPKQSVKFLSAEMQLQLRIRAMGLEADDEELQLRIRAMELQGGDDDGGHDEESPSNTSA